jgi:lipoprotein-anchoring transpeptidase ErfK/SrfK
LENVKKFVFFPYPIQAFGVYEYGNLIKWGPTSMGKKSTPTKKGLMFANWKKEVAISTVSDEWKLRWNVNVANFDGIGWHQYAMPGYPASHSCLRMLEEDAKWMYTW